MLVKLKKRTLLVFALLLLVAWFASSCGGDGDDDENGNPGGDIVGEGTATSAPDNDSPLPTFTPGELTNELLTESRAIVYSIEVAGGLRKTCDSGATCPPVVPLQQWDAANSRCSRMESFAPVKSAGPEPFAKLYDSASSTCKTVAENMTKLNANTSPAQHKTFAEAALGGLPAAITAAAESQR